jgi:hypothetical protein
VLFRSAYGEFEAAALADVLPDADAEKPSLALPALLRV